MRCNLGRVGWLSASLAFLCPVVGCLPEQLGGDGDNASVDYALVSTNGLSMINGLSMLNGLASGNGLSMINGLSMTNGLSSTVGLMTTDAGRQTVSYLVRCALAAGDYLDKKDPTGTTFRFTGALGLAPQYKSGACD